MSEGYPSFFSRFKREKALHECLSPAQSSLSAKHGFPLTQQATKAIAMELTPRPTRRKAQAGLFFLGEILPR